jgi:hypothetical protein
MQAESAKPGEPISKISMSERENEWTYLPGD